MSISRVSLYHLETLLWIDRLGTFSAAAERLNTTQPAVSARMRELEQRLGTRLFRRDGRTMSLTAAGRKLVRDCDPLLRDMQIALLGSGGFAEASGVVRIGAGEIAAASCLPDFVADLKADMPNVGLEIEIDLTANRIGQIQYTPVDGTFPNWRAVVPTGEEMPSTKPELNDGPEHVHFNHAYIGDLAKMGKLLSGASMLHPRSASHPCLVTFGERADCFAVLMPMRRAVDRSAVLTRNVVMAG